ncbi:hypothetical protein KW791_03250, partial [Candidatus Parcubacteria bacterium]|nr:hypothetical protein [Candidatus Parcubacteria bacterium]
MNKLTAKILVWHGVVALLAGWLWDFGRSVRFNPVLGIDLQPLAVLNFILLVSVVVLGFILFQQRKWILSIGAIIGLLFMGYYGFTPLNLLGLAIFLLLALHGFRESIRDLKERNKINMKRALQFGLFPIVIGLFIMISFAAYQSNFINEVKNQK